MSFHFLCLCRPARLGLACLAAALAAALLAGCGAIASVGALVSGARPAKPAWSHVTIAAAPDANTNSALAVDVVLVRDKALLARLSAMSASAYFAAKSDLQRTFPDALAVIAVEITPGQLIRIDGKRYDSERVWAALAYANYANPGEHRARLMLDQSAYLLQLDAQEFVASDVKPRPAR
jgi:type VI secretion system protein